MPQRKDGRYYIRVRDKDNARSANGRLKYVYFYGNSMKEAKDKAKHYNDELAIYGTTLDKQITTLSQCTYEWLYIECKPTKSLSTFQRHMSVYNKHIKNSDLGCMLIKDIKPANLQKFINSKNTLSKSSISKIKIFLKMVFDFAKKNKLVHTNPVVDIALPTSKVKPKKLEVLTIDEQARYMHALEKEKRRMILLTILYSGLRIGEAIALKWDNIDLQKNTITICESYKYVKMYDEDGTGKYIIDKKTPKTKKGERIIPIPNFLATELKEYQHTTNSNKENLAFCSSKGTPLTYGRIRDANIRVCKTAGIEPIGLHGLRHTFATRSIENGAAPKTVSDLLGHTKVETTLNLYVHPTEDSKREAANFMDALYNKMKNNQSSQ